PDNPVGISAKRGQAVKARPVNLHRNTHYLPTPPFLVDYVKQELVDDPNGWYRVLGDTPEQRQQPLQQGGLDIITTLRPDWQKDAQKAANAPWAETPQHPDYTPEPDVGLV